METEKQNMHEKISRIDPLQEGKRVAFLYAVLGVLISPYFLLLGAIITMLMAPGAYFKIIGVVCAIMVIFPIFYGAMGFIFGILEAWIYNRYVRWACGFNNTFSTP